MMQNLIPETSSEDQIPSFLGISEQVLSAIEQIDIPNGNTFAPKDYLPQYSRLYSQVSQFDDLLGRCDIARGEVAWLKGTILNLLKPITPGQNGLLRHGEWNAFLRKHGLSPDTSEDLRHIAEQFTRLQARHLGYTNMVGIYRSERRLGKEGISTVKKTIRSNKEAMGDENDKYEGDQPRTLRLSDLPAKFRRITESLAFIREEMPNAADLFKNPEGNKQLLDSLHVLLDEILNLVRTIQNSGISQAYKKICKYVKEGQIDQVDEETD